MATPRTSSHRASRIRGDRPTEPSRPRPLGPAAPVANPTRPRELIDYALQRRGLLERLGGASLLSVEMAEVCDADPYLLRAAKNLGEPTERKCPVCRKIDLVHVTYVFGAELGPYSGRLKPSDELPAMAFEHGEFRVYVVEVCTGCAWNHLHLSYTLGDGVPRRPLARPADLLD